MYKYLFRLFIIFFTVTILLNCSDKNTITYNDYDINIWDTSFTVDTVSFPDTQIINRSLKNMGNLKRLKGFIGKSISGKDLKIGFIGGSITEGAVATSEQLRYANRFCNFLSNTFTKSNFEVINAGVGGTTSRFGCSRAKGDLLFYDPDLIIIEFAVNDDPKDSIINAYSMEGLIRQCLMHDEIPIIIFFTLNKFGDTLNHNLQTRIADHYNLPIVSYLDAVWPLIESNIIEWNYISPDAVHPNNKGHLICAYLLYQFIVEIYNNNSNDNIYNIPSPYFSDMYQYAGIHTLSDTILNIQSNDYWETKNKNLERIGYTTDTNNAVLEFSTNAREITIGYQYHINYSSRLEISINQQKVDTISNYFAEDWGSGYMKLYQIFLQQEPFNKTITLKNLDNKYFEINYILYVK